MIDLLISNKSIAIIFEKKKEDGTTCWKIAFGKTKKKILNGDFSTLQTAIEKARKLGFGGYRTFSKSHTYAMRKESGRMTLRGMLERAVNWKTSPTMFVDEKNWRSVYMTRHANRT